MHKVQMALCAGLALAVAIGGCAAQPDAALRLDEITAIGTLTAPASDTDITIAASAKMTASDPAIVRLYAWPPEQAAAVQAQTAANGGKLGRWAMAPVRSAYVEPGRVALLELEAVARPRWLYVLAVEPLSLRSGGAISVSDQVMTFRRTGNGY